MVADIFFFYRVAPKYDNNICSRVRRALFKRQPLRLDVSHGLGDVCSFKKVDRRIRETTTAPFLRFPLIFGNGKKSRVSGEYGRGELGHRSTRISCIFHRVTSRRILSDFFSIIFDVLLLVIVATI